MSVYFPGKNKAVKSDFMTVATHELRTPINGIFSLTSILRLVLNFQKSDKFKTFYQISLLFLLAQVLFAVKYFGFFTAVLGVLQMAIELIIDNTVLPLMATALESTEMLLDTINELVV